MINHSNYKNYGKPWTRDEINILEANFHILPMEKIMKLLSERSEAGILGKAYIELGLHAPPISKHFKGDYFNNPYKTLSESERAYIAGIFDGEGSIYKSFTKKFHIRIFIVNTNSDLINWLHKKLPYSHIFRQKPRKKHHKKRYTIHLSSIYTVHLLKLIQPFLIVKKSEADFIIKLFNNLAKGISWREQIAKGILNIPK